MAPQDDERVAGGLTGKESRNATASSVSVSRSGWANRRQSGQGWVGETTPGV